MSEGFDSFRFNSAIARPCIEPDVSRTRATAQRAANDLVEPIAPIPHRRVRDLAHVSCGKRLRGSGNLASDAVSAALAYRAQAPVLDGLMKELGLDGSSLSGLVKGAADAEAEKPTPAPAKPAKLAKPRDNDADEAPTGEAAE